MSDLKECSNCLEQKELSFFYKRKKNDDTYRYNNVCIKCHNEKSKEYNNNNREKVLENKKNYYSKNKDKFLEYQTEFRKDNTEKIKDYHLNYYENNKEALKEYKKKYYFDNKDRLIEKSNLYYGNNTEIILEKSKRYNNINKSKINEYKRVYNKSKRDSDPLFRLKNNIRTYIYTSLRNKDYKKESTTFEIIGLSQIEFIKYIESKFDDWMTWENYGKYNGELNYGWDIDHIIPMSSANTEDEIYKLNHYTNLQPLCSKINRDIKRDKIITNNED